MTTATTMITTATTNNNKSIESRYLTNYIRNVQQASKGTAAQYEYRLLKFEKYVVTMASEEEEQQQEREQPYPAVLFAICSADNGDGITSLSIIRHSEKLDKEMD